MAKSLELMTGHFARYDEQIGSIDGRVADIEKQMEARKLMVADYQETKRVVGDNCDEIRALRTWQTEEQTTSKNARSWGSAAWAVLGSGVSAIIMWVLLSFAQTQHKPITTMERSKMTVEHVQPTAPLPHR